MSLSPPQNKAIIEGISVSLKNGGKIKSEVKNVGIFLYEMMVKKSENVPRISLFSNREG